MKINVFTAIISAVVIAGSVFMIIVGAADARPNGKISHNGPSLSGLALDGSDLSLDATSVTLPTIEPSTLE
jgi:hypothetical protein